MTLRNFEDKPAKREQVPVLLALCGPSSSGKTFSALRLATGFQRVTPGEIFVLDTEARRALHYADRFQFRHVEFGAPFSPLDYLAAVEYCVSKGAKTIVVDSTSHEHEGPGGLLEMHAAGVKRMAGDDFKKAERVKMLAWSEPKQQRRRFINTLMQMRCNVILCFRAKEKLSIKKGQDPEPLGYMPIGGEEYVYEMTCKLLLLPGSSGTPTLTSDYPGERAMIKVPMQFRGIFPVDNPPQLTEDVGEQLARWAAGGAAVTESHTTRNEVEGFIGGYVDAANLDEFVALERERETAWKRLTKADKERVKAASDAARARLQPAGEGATA